MKLRISLLVLGGLTIGMSAIVIFAVFHVSHGTLSVPDPLDTGGRLTLVADRYAGFVAARVLSVLLVVLGAGIALAGPARTLWPRGAAVFLIVAGLLMAGAGFVITLYGAPAHFHIPAPESRSLADVGVHVFLAQDYSVFAWTMLPFGIAAAILGTVLAAGRRASRPAPADE